MPTLTVVCGSDPGKTSDIIDYANVFFLPSSNAYASAVTAHTGYTGLDALSSEDTSSFTTADIGAIHADTAGRSGCITRGRQDAATTIPAGALNLTASIVAIARSTPADGLTWTLDVSAETDAGSDVPGEPTRYSATAPRSVDWTRHTAPIRPSGADLLDPATWRTAVEGRYLRVGVGAGGAGVVDVAYMAVEFTWDSTRHRVPHLRGFQRGSDGQGITGGKRGMQTRSRQASIRRGPGSFH